jgi:hypothetical protein
VDLIALTEETRLAYTPLAGNTAGKRLNGRPTKQHSGENRHKMSVNLICV